MDNDFEHYYNECANLREQLKLADKHYLELKQEFERRVSKILDSVETLAPVVAVMSDSGPVGFPVIRSLEDTTNWKHLRSKYPKHPDKPTPFCGDDGPEVD